MYDFNFSNNPIKDWHSDQNWILLDPTVKGFFAQLVLISSQTKPYGVITSDEKKIKKIIGIPNVEITGEEHYKNFEPKKGDLSKTLFNYFNSDNNKGISIGMIESLSYALGDEDLMGEDDNILFKIQNNYNLWMSYLWKNKWKKQLNSVMIVIDQELIEQFPELSGRIGDYFIPISYNIATNKNNIQDIPIKPKIARKRNKTNIDIIIPEELYFELDNDEELKFEALPFLNVDISKILNLKNVHKSLIKPLTEEDKKTIWDLGISLISLSNDKKDISQARGIMAKSMKKYGKDSTVSAIIKMSLIKEKQLNPHAYFIKILEIERIENEKIISNSKANVGSSQSLVFL